MLASITDRIRIFFGGDDLPPIEDTPEGIPEIVDEKEKVKRKSIQILLLGLYHSHTPIKSS